MVEVRMAEGEADAIRAFRAYKQMHDEKTVPGSFSPIKTLTNIFRFMNGPRSVVLLAVDDEKVAGVLTLVEETLWFSEEGRCISDKGLYVAPDYRDGDVAKLLMEAAQKVGDDAELPVFITINNGRRKRGGRSAWERTGATLGYDNRGAVLAHFPED